MPAQPIGKRVNQTRKIQRNRLASFGLYANSQMPARYIRRFCKLDEKGDQLLEQVTDKLGLLGRSFTRILKRARTIVGFAESESIQTLHLSEATQYHGVDRKLGVRVLSFFDFLRRKGGGYIKVTHQEPHEFF